MPFLPEKVNNENSINWCHAPNPWSDEEKKELFSYTCSFCKEKIITDKLTSCSKCPYCGRVFTKRENMTASVRPDLMIPFKNDKNFAREKFYKKLKRKILLPKVFKDKKHMDDIMGIYVPMWVFDLKCHAEAVFKGTKSTKYDEKSVNREVKHYEIKRGGYCEFSHIPSDAFSKIDILPLCVPVDSKNLTDFNKAYLEGFYLQDFDINYDVSKKPVEEKIYKKILGTLKKQVDGFSDVEDDSLKIDSGEGNVSLILIPFWVLTTTWRRKEYHLVLNDSTGKFSGNLPASILKTIEWFLIFSAIAFICLTLLYVL